MKPTSSIQPENMFTRPKKNAVLRARCTDSLHQRLHRVAAIREADASDLIRDAVVQLVTEFESRLRVA